MTSLWTSCLVNHVESRGLSVRSLINSETGQPLNGMIQISVKSLRIKLKESYTNTICLLNCSKYQTYQLDSQSVVKRQFAPICHVRLNSNIDEEVLVEVTPNCDFVVNSGADLAFFLTSENSVKLKVQLSLLIFYRLL